MQEEQHTANNEQIEGPSLSSSVSFFKYISTFIHIHFIYKHKCLDAKTYNGRPMFYAFDEDANLDSNDLYALEWNQYVLF